MRTQTTFLSLVLCATAPLAVAEDLPQVDQTDLNAMVTSGDMASAVHEAFEAGDELTEHSFDAAAGVGANIGEGRIFTRIPRADLDGPTEWANHFPRREGGANATSCIACHNAPFANGAGDVALNVVVDPAHSGDPKLYLERNTLPLFALGIPQRLAEEISTELVAQREAAVAIACRDGQAMAELTSKGVDYGSLRLERTRISPCRVNMYTAGLQGVDSDLIVKPFGWKGNEATIRGFTRGAAHNELGLQAVEIVGDLDGDYDGVTHELTVGDMTALTIYMAALERPVSKIELDDLGLVPLDAAERGDILAGEVLFHQVGCHSCHTSEMMFDDPTFSEPSVTAGYYDAPFPDGSDPVAHGLAMDTRLTIDLTTDQPNNQVVLADGRRVHLGAVRTTDDGAVANWFTDFKRHDMGPALADPADPLGVGAAMFLTRSLAGVGDTGPWLHDGRATTLHDAVMMHGGDGTAVTATYSGLAATEQAQLTTFLESLVYYQADGDH